MTNSMTVKCQYCGKQLPPSHKGPCPNCGKTGKAVEVVSKLTLSLALSATRQKIHRYSRTNPRFFWISITLSIVGVAVSYLLGGLIGMLVAVIVAVLNWWITPHVRKMIVEISTGGDSVGGTKQAKEEGSGTVRSNSRIRPTVVAIIFAASISLFIFMYRWVVISEIFQTVYKWFPTYASVLAVLCLVFGVVAAVSFVWLLVEAFKRKEDTDSVLEQHTKVLEELRHDMEGVKSLLNSKSVTSVKGKETPEKD